MPIAHGKKYYAREYTSISSIIYEFIKLRMLVEPLLMAASEHRNCGDLVFRVWGLGFRV
jgi:hypothetical protein